MQVEVSNISIRRESHVLLEDVSVSFPENKITAIIGRSGSGKSSLLRVINGLLRPASGQVAINQRPFDYEHQEAERLQMGYAVQGSALFPHLNTLQNISIAARIKKEGTKDWVRARTLMQQVGLAFTLETKYPHQLSGGEQQRVSLCRALYLNPSLLLMDEPFGALDPLTRYEIQQLVLTLQRQQPRTILLVTHDMREAKMLADFILVLEAGRLVQFDRTAQLLAEPAHPVVSALIQAALT
jgi:osmoprotectant transport system ATP-binding protein